MKEESVWIAATKGDVEITERLYKHFTESNDR